MRKIVKDYNIKPLSLQIHRQAYQNALNHVIVNGGWTSTATDLYKSAPIIRALNTLYNGKCAYCEVKPVGSPAQVEHFRPKDGVANEFHTGYYWLAYEWSNLLLACGNCNSSKGNNFPIENVAKRVTRPTLVGGILHEDSNGFLNNPLVMERPILINPEIDNPKRHLVFSPTGKVLNLTRRGEISIQRYSLNRDELFVSGRKKVLDLIYDKLFKRLDRYKNKERSAKEVVLDLVDVINDEIIGPIIREESFTEFYKTVLLFFDDFIIKRFSEVNIRILLRLSFEKVINEN